MTYRTDRTIALQRSLSLLLPLRRVPAARYAIRQTIKALRLA